MPLCLAVALLGTALVAQQPPATPSQPASGQQADRVGEEMRVSADEIDRMLREGKTVLLDVREAKELEEFGTLEGAIHIPLGQLENRLGELPKDKLILTA